MTHNKKMSLVFALLLALLVLILSVMTSSCEVLKSKHRADSDSTHVIKGIEGNVTKSGSESEKELDYYRKTWLFGQPQSVVNSGQDTVYMQPEVKTYYNTQLQPIAYIEEKGNLKEKDRQYRDDSLWRLWSDSMNKHTVVKDESKETKVLDGWQQILITWGGVALLILVFKLISNYKITQK